MIRRAADVTHEAVSLLTWPTGAQHPAVLGFFVLSGFCIHYPFERRAMAGDGPPVWKDYFRRRFLRIMPVYWVACLLGVIFVAAEWIRPTGNPLLTLHSMASREDFVVRAVGLAGIYPREILAGNYTLTTVTVEMLMYALYPLFYMLAGRSRWISLGAIFLGLHAIAIAMLPHFTPYWVYNSVFMLGIFWYAGALAAHLYLRRRVQVSGPWLLAAWAVFLGLKATPYFYGLNLLKQAAWSGVCLLGILWCLRWEPQIVRRGSSGILYGFRRLGDFSYSLYAVHTPVIMLASWTLLQFGIHRYSMQLLVTLAASVAATLAIYFGVERVCYRPATRPKSPAYSNNVSAGSMVT